MLKKSRIILLLLCLLLPLTSACSVYMAANQPSKKNVDLFSYGTHRSLLLTEFGNPQASFERDGQKCETFRFIQGYSKGAKVGRAFLHGAADVFTWGLWEVIGTPVEVVADGNDIAYEVCYDSEDNINLITLISQKDGK